MSYLWTGMKKVKMTAPSKMLEEIRKGRKVTLNQVQALALPLLSSYNISLIASYLLVSTPLANCLLLSPGAIILIVPSLFL